MERFYKSNNNDIEFYTNASSSKNTKRSTANWHSVFQKWSKLRGLEKDIHEYKPDDLNEILKKFYVELRKTDGSDYEPNCLKVMLSSLDR